MHLCRRDERGYGADPPRTNAGGASPDKRPISDAPPSLRGHRPSAPCADRQLVTRRPRGLRVISPTKSRCFRDRGGEPRSSRTGSAFCRLAPPAPRSRAHGMWTLAGDSTPPESVAHRFVGILRAPRVNDEALLLPIEATQIVCSLRSRRRRRRDACDRQMPFTLRTASTHASCGYRSPSTLSRREIDEPGVSRRPARFGDPLAQPAGSVLPRVRRESSDPPLAPLSPHRFDRRSQATASSTRPRPIPPPPREKQRISRPETPSDRSRPFAGPPSSRGFATRLESATSFGARGRCPHAPMPAATPLRLTGAALHRAGRRRSTSATRHEVWSHRADVLVLARASAR